MVRQCALVASHFAELRLGMKYGLGQSTAGRSLTAQTMLLLFPRRHCYGDLAFHELARGLGAQGITSRAKFSRLMKRH